MCWNNVLTFKSEQFPNKLTQPLRFDLQNIRHFYSFISEILVLLVLIDIKNDSVYLYDPPTCGVWQFVLFRVCLFYCDRFNWICGKKERHKHPNICFCLLLFLKIDWLNLRLNQSMKINSSEKNQILWDFFVLVYVRHCCK